MKDDIFSELIFRHFVCSIGNTNDNDVEAISQISNDYLFILYGHLGESTNDFCPARLLVCYLSIRVFCFTKKRRSNFFFSTLITFCIYISYTKVIYRFSLFSEESLPVNFFFYIKHNHISTCQCVHMLSMWQILSLKVAVKCSFLETDVM
jgi:hypothetical protein